MRRAAVIGPAPVVRTAATVATAVVVTRGIRRRRGRRVDGDVVGKEGGAWLPTTTRFPNDFTGQINWVEIDVAEAAENTDHLISPEKRLRIAMARQ